ncbi:hypothetical protein P8452_37017 [Trifolium repens]|nr:hypothetical protein P8452_37017 [Trifolium repens]
MGDYILFVILHASRPMPQALNSMKCVAAVKRKVVQEEDIYFKFLTSFSLMKKEVINVLTWIASLPS